MANKRTGSLVLVTGGVRSGKSTFAEKIAAESGKKVIYVATAGVEDEEMRERVAQHRKRRSPGVKTFEEPLAPDLILENEATENSLVLVDCLTMLLSNIILKELESEGAVKEGEDIFADETMLKGAAERTLDYIRHFAATAKNSPADIVVVTNEVGMGVVPAYPLGRVFRDLSGRANQVLAAEAEQVWMVVCGIAQRIK